MRKETSDRKVLQEWSVGNAQVIGRTGKREIAFEAASRGA